MIQHLPDTLSTFDGDSNPVDACVQKRRQKIHGPGGHEVQVEGNSGQFPQPRDEIREEHQMWNVMAVARIHVKRVSMRLEPCDFLLQISQVRRPQ